MDLPQTPWPPPPTAIVQSEATNPLWSFMTTNPVFTTSFAAGAIILLAVSWYRLFNEHHGTPRESEPDILWLLPPGSLRNVIMLIRAYVIYAGLVLMTFTVLSFTWAILDFLGDAGVTVPQAGALPWINADQVNNPLWPLLVCLTMIGITKFIPRIDVVERVFRRLAHKAAGIPPFLMVRTAEIIATELRDIPESSAFNRRAEVNAAVGRIAAKQGQPIDEDLIRWLDRIEILRAVLLDERSTWPGERVRNRFAVAIDRLESDIETLSDKANSALFWASQADPDEDDPQRAGMRFVWLQDNYGPMRRTAESVHRNLCALLAVFIEHDPNRRSDAPAGLRTFLDRVADDPELLPQEAPAEGGLLAKLGGPARLAKLQAQVPVDRFATAFLACAFLVVTMTWIGTEIGWNGEIPNHSSFQTAVTQSVLVLATTLPPLLAGLAIADTQAGSSRRKGNLRPSIGGLVGSFAVGYVIALPLVSLYFLFYFQNAVSDPEVARSLFLNFAILYVIYALLGAVQAAFAAYAARMGGVGPHNRPVKIAAAHSCAALLVLGGLYVSVHGKLGFPTALGALRGNWFDLVRIAAISFLATSIVAQTSDAMRRNRTSRAARPHTVPGRA